MLCKLIRHHKNIDQEYLVLIFFSVESTLLLAWKKNFIQKPNKKIKHTWYLFQNTFCFHNVCNFKASSSLLSFFLQKHYEVDGVFNHVRDEGWKE